MNFFIYISKYLKICQLDIDSEERKNKNREYGREWYKNLSEKEKQKLVE